MTYLDSAYPAPAESFSLVSTLVSQPVGLIWVENYSLLGFQLSRAAYFMFSGHDAQGRSTWAGGRCCSAFEACRVSSPWCLWMLVELTSFLGALRPSRQGVEFTLINAEVLLHLAIGLRGGALPNMVVDESYYRSFIWMFYRLYQHPGNSSMLQRVRIIKEAYNHAVDTTAARPDKVDLPDAQAMLLAVIEDHWLLRAASGLYLTSNEGQSHKVRIGEKCGLGHGGGQLVDLGAGTEAEKVLKAWGVVGHAPRSRGVLCEVRMQKNQ